MQNFLYEEGNKNNSSDSETFFFQALIFVMPLLGVGHILTLLVKPTVRSIGVPLVVAVSDAMEAVITSTQGFVISLPYCFLNRSPL